MAQHAPAPIVGALATGYAPYRRAAADVHNEATFRYFLDIERRRAEHAGHSVVLVLVSLRSAPGCNQRLAPRTAAAVFGALGASVREVDFVGWFRHGQVAAATLVQRGSPQSTAITARLTEALKRELRDLGVTLRLRVVPLGTFIQS